MVMSQNITTVTADELDELPTANKVIECIILVSIIVVSVLGNGSLWIVVLKSRALRTITSMFILGLSLADLMVATINMPVTVYTIIVGHWPLSRDACIATGYLNMLTLSTSVLSLCNISINRYFMVCQPARFKDIYTTRNSVLMVAAVVTCAALLSVPPLVGWSDYVYTHTHSFCFADWVNSMSYSFFMIGCCFGVPCVVMTVCNICIIRSVRHSRMRVKVNIRQTTSSVYSSAIFNRDSKSSKFRDNSCYNGSESSFTEKGKGDKENNQTMSNHNVLTLNNRNNNTQKSFPTNNLKHNKVLNITNVSKTESVVEKDGTTVVRNASSHFSRLSDSSTESDINSALITRKSAEKVNIEKVQLRKITMKSDTCTSFNGKPDNSLNDTTPKDNNLLHPQWRSGNNESVTSSTTAVTVGSPSETSISIDHPSAGTESSTEPNIKKQKSTTSLRRREEIRLAFSLVVVVVIFVICWLPYCISMLISVFYKGHVPREFHMFTLIIGYANSGCNPIIYGVMNKRFKVGFKRLFCFWKSVDISFSST